jgi:hypothetical protein
MSIFRSVGTEPGWIVGAFGLGGVVVGGLITTVGGWWAERRSTRSEARVGAQLLRRQLQTVARSSSQAVNTHTWGPTRSLDVDAWSTYQAGLVGGLRPAEWITVARTIEHIRETAALIELHAPNWKTEIVQLTPEFTQRFVPLWDDCRTAFIALYRASQAPSDHKDIGSLVAQLGYQGTSTNSE